MTDLSKGLPTEKLDFGSFNITKKLARKTHNHKTGEKLKERVDSSKNYIDITDK